MKPLNAFHRRSKSPDGLMYKCIECGRKYQKDNWEKVRATGYAWREQNPERHKANQKRSDRSPRKQAYNLKYRKDNKAACNARVVAWLQKNFDRKDATNKQWKIANAELIKIANREYRIANKDKECAKVARHRAAKMKACPPWADMNEIGRIYARAQEVSRETGVQHHVDHIFPLQSKWVCGMHVPLNLQIIPGRDNISKSNRRWPGSEELLAQRETASCQL